MKTEKGVAPSDQATTLNDVQYNLQLRFPMFQSTLYQSRIRLRMQWGGTIPLNPQFCALFSTNAFVNRERKEKSKKATTKQFHMVQVYLL